MKPKLNGSQEVYVRGELWAELRREADEMLKEAEEHLAKPLPEPVFGWFRSVRKGR